MKYICFQDFSNYKTFQNIETYAPITACVLSTTYQFTGAAEKYILAMGYMFVDSRLPSIVIVIQLLNLNLWFQIFERKFNAKVTCLNTALGNYYGK